MRTAIGQLSCLLFFPWLPGLPVCITAYLFQPIKLFQESSFFNGKPAIPEYESVLIYQVLVSPAKLWPFYKKLHDYIQLYAA